MTNQLTDHRNGAYSAVAKKRISEEQVRGEASKGADNDTFEPYVDIVARTSRNASGNSLAQGWKNAGCLKIF